MKKTRDFIAFYINKTKYQISGAKCQMSLADFLRYELSLTGTKIVCAEGDCGACTVLLASIHSLDPKTSKLSFKAVNSCILPLFAVDSCHIVSVEGLKLGPQLHPVQDSMLNCFASQCGYCTPGFVCAMTALHEDSILQNKPITEKRAKNFMTGNLCRCTGYESIIEAALSLPLKFESLQDRYSNINHLKELKRLAKIPVEISENGFSLFLPTTLKQALLHKQKYPEVKIVAGATDLGVAINKGRLEYTKALSLQNISKLWKIKRTKSYLEIPARVSLAYLQKYLEEQIPEMDQLLNIFASPQIKNSATLVGNIVNASPIGDTIPFLMIQDSLVMLESSRAKRSIALQDFYQGYKKLNMKAHEIVTSIRFALPKKDEIIKLYKVSLRKDLDISAVTLATKVKVKDSMIHQARIAFGGVGPVVLRLNTIEKDWLGKKYEPKLFSELSKIIQDHISPQSDIRGSKEYRILLCKNLLQKMADEFQ